MSDTTGNEYFGVHFHTKELHIDEEEVKEYFSKYGTIVFVKQVLQRMYVNFKSKTDAEKCLSDSPDSKYGEIKQGKGWIDAQNSRRVLPNNYQSGYGNSTFQNSRSFESKARSLLGQVPHFNSESERNNDGNFQRNYNYREDASKNGKTNHMPKDSMNNGMRKDKRFSNNSREFDEHPKNGDSRKVGEHYPSEKIAFHESKQGRSDYSSRDDGPPPLLSAYDSPPSLLSCDSSPPPLVSALKPNPTGISSTKGLLPTPPVTMRCDYNPESHSYSSSPFSPKLSSAVSPDGPPPLISAVPRSEQNYRTSRNSISCTSSADYLQKYENYLLIANIPEDTNRDELEKVLYPHIPICVSDAEVTNINLKILYCLAIFKTAEEAAKAAKQLNGVELRSHCLNMIRLDELRSFGNIPF